MGGLSVIINEGTYNHEIRMEESTTSKKYVVETTKGFGRSNCTIDIHKADGQIIADEVGILDLTLILAHMAYSREDELNSEILDDIRKLISDIIALYGRRETHDLISQISAIVRNQTLSKRKDEE